MSTSPAPTAVVNGPTWKSSIPTTRSPPLPRMTTLALTAEHTADRSSAASAWHSEPPMVPRLRTTGSAITFSASRNTGKCRASRSDFRRSTWRVIAPIRISPSCSRMKESSSSPLMSIRCSGLASRSFIIGSRLWPPAMMRASGPWRSSAAIAPSTLVARSYSNGAGVCRACSSGQDRRAGSRLRGAPMSSRCSYWTGASEPITGESGSFSGALWRTEG